MTGHKEYKEGVDCVKVEASVVCHDGESIQVIKKIKYLKIFNLIIICIYNNL